MHTQIQQMRIIFSSVFLFLDKIYLDSKYITELVLILQQDIVGFGLHKLNNF